MSNDRFIIGRRVIGPVFWKPKFLDRVFILTGRLAPDERLMRRPPSRVRPAR